MSGNFKKLKITAYKDKGFCEEGKSFEAMLNPESMSLTYKVEYNDDQGSGSPDPCVKYKKTPPSSLKFDLILDGTGIVDPKRKDVEAELDKLKSVLYDYNGSSHQPNFAKIEYAQKSAFTGRLESMIVNVTRFRSDGSYLRVKVSLSFLGEELVSKAKGANSPDMTHARLVTAGKLLPTLTREIYNDEQYLLKVAAINKLDSLIYQVPGQELMFPPLSAQ